MDDDYFSIDILKTEDVCFIFRYQLNIRYSRKLFFPK